ncbi:hypothetical protein ABIE77_005228 [Sinorhizobium fredii]
MHVAGAWRQGHLKTLSDAAIIAPQRAWGKGRLVAKSERGGTRIAELYQEGCAKIRLPKTFDASMEAVLINSSGGVTGGDRLEWSFAAGAGTSLTLTTQACEKIYKASAGTASITTHISVAAGARVDWLPQENDPFRSRLAVSLAGGRSGARREFPRGRGGPPRPQGDGRGGACWPFP